MSGYPDGNPKTAQGALKVPLHLVPPSASHFLALAFKDGAAKYGPYNWREKGVSASVYYAAAKRHLDAWWDGEDLSPDALVHHLGHVLACCAIVLDALTIGKLNDDRPPRGATPQLQSGFAARVALDSISMEPPISAPVIAHQDGHTSDGGGIVAHDIAAARQRDLPPDEDEVVFPRACPAGGCGED